MKRVYYQRLHRRNTDLASHEEFKAMIQQLCDDVPINTDNILRANRSYVAHYLALGAEQSSASLNSAGAQDYDSLND